MALQTSGPISFQQINVELNKTTTATISLNDAAVRKLLGKESGTISMQDAYGKSNFAYKAYAQNGFANFAPPGAIAQSPVTWWVTGFRIESLDQSLVLNRMVGYNSSGAVLFDLIAPTGAPSTNNNAEAYQGNKGWVVERTEYYTTNNNVVTINQLQYSLSCFGYFSQNSWSGTVHRVVVYDASGNEYEINGHRNLPLSATHSRATIPATAIILGTKEIAENNS